MMTTERHEQNGFTGLKSNAQSRERKTDRRDQPPRAQTRFRRRGTPLFFLPGALLVSLLCGCGGPLLGVNVFVVGERTSLEKQVLGNYRALNADFESFGSVRGVDEFGQLRQPPPVTDSKRAAVLAMQNRSYNRDDVTDFLRAGFVGENNRGTLTLFDEALGAEPPARRDFIRAVVAEENEDRETLIRRLIETTPGVRPEDHERVRSLFASLNRDTAPRGSRVQREDDTWSAK